MSNILNHFKIRVYYEDTDAGGIVYHSNYLKFLERARTEWLRRLGVTQYELLQDNLAFVVKNVSIDYCKPVKLDDELLVITNIKQLKKASILFEQTIYKQVAISLEQVITATVLVASIDLTTMRATKIPVLLYNIFSTVE